MITLMNQFAADIEEKKGSITEDEVRLASYQFMFALHSPQTVAFKSTLLSVGIANPVTK